MFSRIAVRAVSRQGASAILTRRAVPALCHSAKALSSIPKLQKSQVQVQVQVQSLPSLACSFNDLPPSASFSTSIPRFARRRDTKVPTETNGPVGSSLIPIINRLQEVVVASGSTTQLNLPQIVVIGSQSSGKSSVLESLVGKDFLPRGSGIVTRRPLILQLNHVDQEEEWGEFGHIPNRKFFDFSLIRQEIVSETDRTTGKYNIIADPIILRVYSPKVLPLTLVDTPGITRVPLPGQAADIELQIRRIVDTYIVPSNAIILAVTPANQDVSTSDSLNIARSVDPEGNRTIGVLTKLDIMDRGTSALNVLQGRTIPLKHGYVGIVNRSQQDIELNKSISSHLQYEEEFFRTNTNYSQLRGKAGARFLGLKCNRLLTKHIHDVLPEIKKDIKNRLQAANKELVELGQSPSESINDKRWLLLQLINKFSLEFHNTLFGFSNTVSTKEIIGGARIRYIFEEIFRKKIEKLKPVNNLTIDEYRTAICNASGPKSSLFVPDGAFEALVKQHILLLREPSLQCADMVMQEVSKIITSIDLKELDRFHILREKINRVIIKVLKKSITGAQTSINNFIDYESSYINTNHPDFHTMSQLREGSTSSADDMPIQSQRQSSGNGLFGFFKKKPDAPKETNEDINDMRIPVEMTDREKQQIRLTRDLLERYFRIVQKNAYDSTIKIVWKHMILDTMDAVHKSFINEIYQDEDPNYLLQESEFIKERRLALQTEIEVLENARKILQETETVSMSELQSDLL